MGLVPNAVVMIAPIDSDEDPSSMNLTQVIMAIAMMQQFVRQFCTNSVPRLTFASGSAVLAKALFDKYTDVDMMLTTPLDPRGMRASELKRRLKNLPGFEVASCFQDDLAKTEAYRAAILSEWQLLTDNKHDSDFHMPGKEKAGPLTFHREADPVNKDGKDFYDTHGRIDFKGGC
ncbi:hypothetical protein Pmar_PMAR018018 [Perkinsus marinus ATCC 50983]|uniref:Uncharacterized protein n=1 Tax=Perkinsus marinus (strain ATCC 50983 / TXsc) TaxID=423536 RepID=C5KRS5_PERM5|nr:hypothetical protein Pmar_PMAR018018 [Perkinsus marinus ATCC 50983]EER12766.1 hypothetical protein Pmar_PMAR018018 [Perkinsus marinus ATCC 50983]|eukprot:XP_002780971.1 hypothetical protein Pmar_PMAR018018 [Perkinsus marinus ATCC 50983]